MGVMGIIGGLLAFGFGFAGLVFVTISVVGAAAMFGIAAHRKLTKGHWLVK